MISLTSSSVKYAQMHVIQLYIYIYMILRYVIAMSKSAQYQEQKIVFKHETDLLLLDVVFSVHLHINQPDDPEGETIVTDELFTS